jgi:Skp family chaperone for outer membrane proteins
MDSIYLWQFLAQHGLDREKVKNWTAAHSISICNKNNGKTFFPSSDVVRLWLGDIVILRRQGLETQLQVLCVKVPTELRDSGIEKWGDSQQLEFWLGMAGGTGLALGGPISAFLVYFAAKILIREETRMHGKGHSKILPFRFKAFCNWIAIGSLAMPASWFITSSLGWNLDVLAVVQSKGGFKSYKDWSEAEKRKSKAESERKHIEYETRRSQEQLKYEAKNLEEDAKFEQERLKEAAREAAAIARQQKEEAEQRLRLDAEMREYNDPAKSAAREQRHMEHLESVGCLDTSGQVIRTIFCLNTEAPPKR